MTTTPRLGITQLEEDQALPEAVVNEGFIKVEPFATRLIVLSKGDNAPAGGESNGDAYLVGSAGTGAFLGEDNNLAVLENGAWAFYTALEGMEIEVLDEDTSYTLRGGTWVDTGSAAGALNDLTDVDTTGVSDGDVLTYDSGSGDWVAAAPTGGGGGTGTSYEGGPITEATTADLATWVNQGTSTVSDGTDCLILKPQVDGFVHGREKAAPATPYDIYMRANWDYLSTAAVTTAVNGVAGILLRDNSDGELLIAGIYYERVAGDEQNTYAAILQRWTNPTTFSANPIFKFNGKPWKWMRINNDGTTVTFYIGQDGKNWIQVGTETIATFVDTIDRIGVAGIASANAIETIITVPYFSTTAPS